MATAISDNVVGKATRRYVKVPGRVALYRNPRSGLYYGFKKLHGKRRECSLRTTDRQIAERRLKDWIRGLEVLDREIERTTLRQLLERFAAATQGKSARTRATNASIIRKLLKSWPDSVDIEVRRIKPSHLDEWLAIHEPRLKNTTYNRYALLLRQLFGLAVRDKIICESPFTTVRCPWKKPQEPRRLVPTEEQFCAIVREVRNQTDNRRCSVSADFIEFLGRAGVGQAEAAALNWSDVDWELGRINVRRRKTGAQYYIPLYPQLHQLLVRIQKEGRGQGNVFSIGDAKHALRSACSRLGYPLFSQRSIRRCLIRQLWRAGIDKKLIAKWQGHQDGGQLIIDTYTEAFGDDDLDYERHQLAKLSC
jgi:integrase